MECLTRSEIIGLLSLAVLFVTAIILIWHAHEMKRATYASAFKNVYDMLQDESMREDRGVVLRELVNKEFKLWSEQEIKMAEKVCHNYDSVAIMVQNGMIKESVVADSWGDSLRRCWKILAPLVVSYRLDRNSEEFWDDFQWLARKAEKYQKKVHIGNGK